MSLFDKLAARSGLAPQEALQVDEFRRAVAETIEFRRILALPRVTWPDPQAVAQELEAELRLPDGEQHLWPVQAMALASIVLNHGGFFPIGVGCGKALISILAAAVLPCRRPLLLVPASLRDQTKEHVLPLLRRHWKVPQHLRVVGYSELSLEKNADMLDELQPDLIVLDECHRVKNPKAGRTRRLTRYLRAHPSTMVVAMSGTVSNRSILDYAHILEWCLRDGSPLPQPWTERQEWAAVLDERTMLRPVGPGALWRFCEGDETPRQGYRRRLVSAPGVVASAEGQLGTSLRITAAPIKTPRAVLAMMQELRDTWTTPNGDLLCEAVEVWRHMRELALGFWYRWKFPPPDGWMQARQEWKRYVRDTITFSRRGLDTELQVAREAAAKGDVPQWIEWSAIKDAFAPETVPEWIDDFAVEAVVKWLAEPGICWVEHRAFGAALAARGIPYFGAGDNEILTTGHTSIAASIAAHAEGKNLQRWSRNLVTSTPTSGKTWEQLLGRTHRQGQEADEVTVEVFLHAPELRASFEQAQGDAQYLEQTLGGRQKLCYADIAI